MKIFRKTKELGQFVDLLVDDSEAITLDYEGSIVKGVRTQKLKVKVGDFMVTFNNKEYNRLKGFFKNSQ